MTICKTDDIDVLKDDIGVLLNVLPVYNQESVHITKPSGELYYIKECDGCNGKHRTHSDMCPRKRNPFLVNPFLVPSAKKSPKKSPKKVAKKSSKKVVKKSSKKVAKNVGR